MRVGSVKVGVHAIGNHGYPKAGIETQERITILLAHHDHSTETGVLGRFEATNAFLLKRQQQTFHSATRTASRLDSEMGCVKRDDPGRISFEISPKLRDPA